MDRLVQRVGELPPRIYRALEPLSWLPFEWHARAAQMAQTTVRRHGSVEVLPKRFSKTIEILTWLDKYDLHLRPTKAQVLRTAIETDVPPSHVAAEVGRLAEMVGQELLIHALTGNKKLTTLGRSNLHLANQLTREGLYNAHAAVSRKTLDTADQRRETARLADFRNRADGIAGWCDGEGRYGVKHYITAPPCFHAGPHRGDIDERWVATGKPSPREAANWLFEVLNSVRTRAAGRGIVPVGIRVVECHESGVPHINLPLWFHSKVEADQFLCILRKTYAAALERLPLTCRTMRPFDIDFQAIVHSPIGRGIDEALAAVNYAYKFVTTGEVGEVALAGDDRSWCKLWKIKQFATWGTPSAAEYKALARPSTHTRAAADAGLIPASIATLIRVAVERNYAGWLELTHPLSRQRTALVGNNTLQVVEHCVWAITFSKNSTFSSRTASLQLCEAYPTMLPPGPERGEQVPPGGHRGAGIRLNNHH